MRAAADLTRQGKSPTRVPPPPPPPPAAQAPPSGQQTQASSQNAASTSNTTLPPPPTLKLSPTPSSTLVVDASTDATAATTIPPPPPPPPPHSSQTQIPPLPSAPPSGNLAAALLGTGTTAVLPPPPPPPPKRTAQSTTTTTPSVSPSRTTTTTQTTPLTPTIVRFPPPPPPPNSTPRQDDNVTPTIVKTASSLDSFLEASQGQQQPPQQQPADDVTVRMSNTSPKKDDPTSQEEPEPATPPPQEEPPQTILRLPPTQPEPLPYTAFAKLGNNNNNTPPPFLARRQEQHTVLLVATEAAHKMAWKNNLLLVDLLNGLMHHVTNTPASQQTQPLAPVRSATKALTGLNWSDVPVQFVLASDETVPQGPLSPLPDLEAQSLLHTAAALQDTDGNLTQELELLEDQVDHLLLPRDQDDERKAEPNNNNTTTDTSSNTSSWHEQRQRQLDQVTHDAYRLTSPLTLPWLRRYRHALDYVTSYAPYDLTSCPAVCLFICTTQELTNPIDTLKALDMPHYLPPPFHNGLWDPDALSRHVLVLHDHVEGPQEWNDAGDLQRALIQTFGPTSTLLRINTIAPETAAQLAHEETQDLWGGGGRCGNCLSVNDRVTLRKYLSSVLVSAALVPALERRIAHLNAVVSERKKGVRNVLKSLWRTTTTKEPNATPSDSAAASSVSDKGSSLNNPDHTVVRYRHDSIEAQTRLLADTLFLLKDYEAALATYRLIRDDYKQDRAHGHYGSCQEMMALCQHALDPYGRARDIFACLETALLHYKKAAEEERAAQTTLYQNNKSAASGQRAHVSPLSTRAATRLCLVMITSSQVCAGRSLEVADLLASASSNETALGAAVLLEQSSAHYFHDTKYRKYAFHMLMSGHMFRTGEQEHHAFRCFTSALHMYRDAQWDELHNHLLSALAAQLYSMGRMALSLQLYAKLVGTRNAPRVSVKSQQKFVNHVLDICNEHSRKALAGSDRMVYPTATRRERLERIAQVIQYTKTALRVLELPNMQLPFIDDETVHVIAEEGTGRTHGTQAEEESAAAAAGIETAAVLGKSGRGDPDVWNQLELECVAELNSVQTKEQDKVMNKSDSMEGGNNNATKKNNTTEQQVVVTKVLAKIDDVDIRGMIAEMDKEKAKRNLAERAKKSSTYKATPPVRALMEPLDVEFVVRNPLGIPIDLVDLQVVARMTGGGGGDTKTVCTNEDAIQITPLAARNEQRRWTFHSSNLEFSVPHYCRVSEESEDPAKQRWKSALEVDPFFVVTKTSMTLDAESVKTISASVCPLVEGDLEILGIRCRLLDDIWIFHPFSLKGELLQNTRSNRANRVRAESLLLKAKVERGMPCLTADLIQPMTTTTTTTTNNKTSTVAVGESSPLLQGQVSKWNLRLSNVGTAPAKSITLKTNLPWITVWDGGDDDRSSKSLEELEKQATSYAIGPSGTFVRIPIDGFGLQVDGEIQPGETVDVAVDLRTSGAGRQDFYMLFRYELVEQNDTVVPCRWLRKMFEVPLYPSLTLNASLIPSYTTQGEHVMSVEITNYRSDRPDELELLVSKITLASRAYKLELLPNQLGSDEFGRGTAAVKLGWQERVTLHFRVVPLDEESPTCLLSQSSLLESSSSSSSSSLSAQATSGTLLNFLCLERAHGQFHDTLVSHQRALARAAAAQDSEDQHPRTISDIRRANTQVSSGLSDVDLDDDDNAIVAPTSIRKLSPPDHSLAFAILVCSWKNDDGSVEGQHHIRGLPIRPMGRASNGCPIVVTADHPSVVSNNFARGPATVPLQVTLQNRLVSHKVDFEFAVEQSKDFDVTGPECFKYALSGGETLQVPLKAIVPTAGVYNIQKIRLTIDDEETEPVAYLFPLQWNVVVKNE